MREQLATRARRSARPDAVHEQRLVDDGRRREARVERAERVLEDHLHPRGAAAAPGAREPVSAASSVIAAGVGSAEAHDARASVDLPHPDSPTRATVSPARCRASTPSTARSTLPATGNSTATPRQESTSPSLQRSSYGRSTPRRGDRRSIRARAVPRRSAPGGAGSARRRRSPCRAAGRGGAGISTRRGISPPRRPSAGRDRGEEADRVRMARRRTPRAPGLIRRCGRRTSRRRPAPPGGTARLCVISTPRCRVLLRLLESAASPAPAP